MDVVSVMPHVDFLSSCTPFFKIVILKISDGVTKGISRVEFVFCQ